jgi:hypothetical protein
MERWTSILVYRQNASSHHKPHRHSRSLMPKHMEMKEPKSWIIRPDPQNHISSPGNVYRVFQRRIYNIWLRIQYLVPSCWWLEGVVCAVAGSSRESVAGHDVEIMSVLSRRSGLRSKVQKSNMRKGANKKRNFRPINSL